MLSNFNNSLKNNKLDLKNQNYSESKLSNSDSSLPKLSENLFGNNDKESLSANNLFTSQSSQSSSSTSSSGKYSYRLEGRYALPAHVYEEGKKDAEKMDFEKAGYSLDELVESFTYDTKRWQEIMNDVIDKRTDLSAAEKEKRKASIDKSVKLTNKKHNGLTYQEATKIYNSIRQKYSGYLAAYVSDGRMEIGKDKATGATLYGAEKRKLDDDRLVEVIRRYGSPEEASEFLRAKSAIEAFKKDMAEANGQKEG